MKNQTYKKGKILFIFTLLVCVSFLPIIGSVQAEASDEFAFIIENTKYDTISIDVSIPSFKYSIKENDNIEYTVISLKDEAFSLTEGHAQLPTIRRMIEIPQGAHPTIVINNVEWEYVSLGEMNYPTQIFPVQKPWIKTGEEREFYIDESYYNTNQFLPEDFVNILEINQIRGRRFAFVEITTGLYNPKEGNLKLMKSCDISLDLPGSDMEKTNEIIERYSTDSYEKLIESILPNYGYYEGFTQPNRDKDSEGFLIIVHDAFSEEIAPLATWKTSMGYDTTVTLTSEIPGGITSANLQAYIQDAYDTWSNPPAYILLVGDTPQIPAITGSLSGGETDTYYVTMDGSGDVFADIHIGRFPAENEAQVTIMVDKTVYYEEGVFPDIEWIKKAAFIASSDADLTAEGTHDYCIDTHMTPNEYTCDKIYERLGGSTSDISNALNDGRSICIYSGHGSPSGWGCVPFDQSDINALSNEGMYPFVCSHACSTSTYEGTSETMSETWVRAENKGGIAMWGSSISTLWPEDDAIQRRTFDAWWNDDMETIGEMTDKGMYDAYQTFGSDIGEFIESYNVMGDASVKIWTDDPFVPEHDITVVDIDIADVVAHSEPQTVSGLLKTLGITQRLELLSIFWWMMWLLILRQLGHLIECRRQP